uniref:Uncharacterized protein n=1 Tax=Candidatus Kentrum eta TaxID=2126337 RepID=A0A450UKY3_9GAMM|nr:MAG: hypothetical protein BECKH772A_GA0070896_100413 [Candidatus Kentron sp. H]VFJ93199.1 MAG: hypothetical protein BECKH772B_GA0070898_100403 [Candidatus Kentron sp. H]VFK00037.1 MAG: hypothetical protein BECKH772C_GA0070978_100393 [Candidatus Kentron sp. H]
MAEGRWDGIFRIMTTIGLDSDSPDPHAFHPATATAMITPVAMNSPARPLRRMKNSRMATIIAAPPTVQANSAPACWSVAVP